MTSFNNSYCTWGNPKSRGSKRTDITSRKLKKGSFNEKQKVDKAPQLYRRSQGKQNGLPRNLPLFLSN